MIKVNYTKSAYFLCVSNLHINKDIDIDIKFDTGASATIVTLTTINDKATEEDCLKLKELIKTGNYITNTFKSATDDELVGIKCYKDNVDIGGIHFDRFYYWLIPTVKYNKALLGDDFIKCCQFTHNIKSDIVITAFSIQDYILNNISGGALSEAQLLEELANTKLPKRYKVEMQGYQTRLVDAETPTKALKTVLKYYKIRVRAINKTFKGNVHCDATVELLSGVNKSKNYYILN